MPFDFQKTLLSLAEYSENAAELLRAAVCENCRSCVSDISDLNRQTLLELSDAERAYASAPADGDTAFLNAAQALTDCVTRAFSAAMLLPDELPILPPLFEIATANAHLAAYPEQIITHDKKLSFYSLHLAANKGRGAHALLITNYLAFGGDRRLFPLALALEAHRNALEHACECLSLISN